MKIFVQNSNKCGSNSKLNHNTSMRGEEKVIPHLLQHELDLFASGLLYRTSINLDTKYLFPYF